MLMRGREALKRSDAELVSYLVAHLSNLGLTLHESVEAKAIERSARGYDVHLTNGETITADAVLNAAGRPPQLHGVALDAAHVEYSEKVSRSTTT